MLLCNNLTMENGFDIALLRQNLRAIMDQKGVKPTTLSLNVGKNPSLVQDLLTKTNDAKLSTIVKLAERLGVPVMALLDTGLSGSPDGPMLYVKGEVAGGQWIEALEWNKDDWHVLPGRPDLKIDVEHRYFLRVEGDSMDMLYPCGTFIECVDVYAGPDPVPGKRVVVTRERPDGMFEATVKELVEINGELWLTPRSTNPSHQAFKAEPDADGAGNVRIIATVVSSVRPE